MAIVRKGTGRWHTDHANKQFGRWLALSYAGTEKGVAWWNCRCKCGTERKVKARKLVSGESKSCGCLARENTSKRTRTHGLSKTREYRIWTAMLKRCQNPDCDSYPWYGGRGISVCPQWDKFETFLADMGKCPSDKHSIDRFPNKDGNYEPGNCRWATQKEQARNTRVQRFLTCHGETKLLCEWAEITGIKVNVIHARLKRGWTVDAAIATPVQRTG